MSKNKLSKVNNSSSKNRLISVVLMGIVSTLIVGPCVAPPLLGSLLYIGQTGDYLLGGSALFMLGFGMGIPLLLVGLGFGYLLPKNGNWLLIVNKIFGFIMLSVAIFMMSKILSIFVINILWTIYFLIIVSYIIYIFIKQLNLKYFISLLLLIIFSYASFYFIYQNINIIQQNKNKLNWRYVNNLSDLEKIINTKDKPVLIDFAAKWCSSCKEYEMFTFKDKNVKDKLINFYLIKIDISQKNQKIEQIIKKYNIYGPPTILIIKNKKIVKKIIGFYKPKEFLEKIEGYKKTNTIQCDCIHNNIEDSELFK